MLRPTSRSSWCSSGGRINSSRALPTAKFLVPGLGLVSLNPGPFNMKEHVLISVFANAGAAFGSGSAYTVGIVNIIRAFYKRNISFVAGWMLIITTQVLGYGWAGLMRKYVVEQAHMWLPGTLVQVSLFWALHEKDERRMSRAKFFVIVLVCSFTWYTVPGYLFPTITNISWACWVFSKSVTAQQIGSDAKTLKECCKRLPEFLWWLENRLGVLCMYTMVFVGYWDKT